MTRPRSVETKKIEKAAILAVKNLIQPCPTIDDKLDEDDKNILVDGSFELYSSKDMSIPNFVGKIDVQVKGTTKKPRATKHGSVKFPVAIENLKRYLEAFHGILFFYVSVHPSQYTAREVYYAQLLPYDINLILNGLNPGQSSTSVRFKPFPTEPKEITRLLMAFYTNREIQLRAEVSDYGLLDEHTDLPEGIKSLKFSTQIFPGESPMTLNSFREGPYIYGENESGQLWVIDKMEDIAACAMGRTVTLSTEGFSMETVLMTGESEDGGFLEFEGVQINLSEKKVNINYTVSGGARKRYNTVRFIQHFAKSGILSIDGETILRSSGLTLSANQEQRLEESAKIYGSIVETLDALHIATDWDIDELSRKEWNDLGFIHNLIVEGKPLPNCAIESPLVYFSIQGSRIYAFAVRQEDGTYRLSDLFSDALFFVFSEPDKITGTPKNPSDPVGAIAALDEEGYRTVENIDLKQVERSFERYPVTASNQNPLSHKLQEMLNAYDKGCVQPERLLAIATLLAKKLHEANPASDIYYTNLMQTIKRSRKLDATEKQRLYDIVIENESYCVKAAAYALLDNKAMAENRLKRCKATERQGIENGPIARYFH